MPSTTNRLFHFNSKALENELPLLRADFDNLAAKSANGSGTEVMQRAEQVSAAIQVVGFDPYLGFLHQPRHGRPALALDLMEEFRPIIADSVVLNIVNHRILSEQDFKEELGVVHLKPEARKKFYLKFEERLQEELQHPYFEYRTSYRRCIELQARLLGKWLTEDIAVYPPLCTR